MATPPCGWTSPPEPLLALQWNSHFCSLPEAYEQYPSTNPFLTTRDTTEEGSITVVFSNFPLDQAHCQSNNKACESRPPKPVQFLEASPPARHGEGSSLQSPKWSPPASCCYCHGSIHHSRRFPGSLSISYLHSRPLSLLWIGATLPTLLAWYVPASLANLSKSKRLNCSHIKLFDIPIHVLWQYRWYFEHTKRPIIQPRWRGNQVSEWHPLASVGSLVDWRIWCP